MEFEQLTVRCACGWETSGTEAEVVDATSEHGLRIHNMTATRDQILAMAVAADPPDAPSGNAPGAAEA